MLMESILLNPRAAFHLGERGIGLEETSVVLHSDTLYSAICIAWAILYGEEALRHELVPTDEKQEDWRPPFLISSAFPFAGSVRFYPKPFLPFPVERETEIDESERRQIAKLKDVEFVSEEVFVSLLRNEPQLPESNDELPHGGTLWLSAGEADRMREDFGVRSIAAERFWSTVKVPRVTLDVKSGVSNIWHFGRVVFRKTRNENSKAKSGYHFLVRYLDEASAVRLKAAVRFLGDAGIGGDRSSGHGLFEPVFSTPPAFHIPPDANAFIFLSLTFPKRQQVLSLLGEASRYRWITRGGWIGGALPTPLRRKTVRMFAEGSLLTGNPNQYVWGQAVDVTPENAHELGLLHRVYRYGFAFPVGVRL